MQYIQKEIVFTLTAGQEEIRSLHNTSKKSQIVEYYFRATASLIDIQLMIDNVSEKTLSIEGERIPLYIDVENNKNIQIKAKNNEATSQSFVIMLLIQEY